MRSGDWVIDIGFFKTLQKTFINETKTKLTDRVYRCPICKSLNYFNMFDILNNIG